MSYGIEILNNNNRILIDENYPNIGFVSTATTTTNLSTSGRQSYPGITGYTTGDLVFSRTATNTNGFIANGWDHQGGFTLNKWWEYIEGPRNTSNQEPQDFFEPSSVVSYLLRDMSGIYSPSTSGYGLEVYKSNGDVIFTSNISKHFSIIASGSFNASVSNVTHIDFPSSTGTYSDLDKYYCLMNPTFAAEIPIFTTLNAALRGYQYTWTSSTTGRIRVWNTGFQWLNYINNVNGPTLTKPDIDRHYMIIKEIG